MKQRILDAVNDAVIAAQQLQAPTSIAFITDAAQMISDAFSKGKKILIAGNGGSLCDAMHFAEELTGFFRAPRPALPAIALSDPGHLTCVGNDIGFDYVFSRGVEAFGQQGDIFIGLTTSGNSPNIIHAMNAAQEKEMQTIAFLGKTGGKLRGVADLELLIEGFTTSDRIQEAHMAAIHIIIEEVEELLFSKIEAEEQETALTH
ncbi:MAG: SIS domain-containing protein [Chlamydiia bacterium]|nr:SIS domain-containing protein [Chlamydiia bacterium]